MSGSAATARARRRLRRASTAASIRPSFSSTQRSRRPSWCAGRRPSLPSITSTASSVSASSDDEIRESVPSLSATHRFFRRSAVRIALISTGEIARLELELGIQPVPLENDMDAPRERRTDANLREPLRELHVDRRIGRRAEPEEPFLPEGDRPFVRSRDARVVDAGVLVRAHGDDPGRFDLRSGARLVFEIAAVLGADPIGREEGDLARAVDGDELAGDVERLAREAEHDLRSLD